MRRTNFTSFAMSVGLELLSFVSVASLDSTELTYSTKAQAGRQSQQDTPTSSAKRLPGMNTRSISFISLTCLFDLRQCTLISVTAPSIDDCKSAGLSTDAESVVQRQVHAHHGRSKTLEPHSCKSCNRQLKNKTQTGESKQAKHRQTRHQQTILTQSNNINKPKGPWVQT